MEQVCAGKALFFKKGSSHSQHTIFMDCVMAQRTLASKDAYTAAQQILMQDGDENARQKRPRRALRMSDAMVAGESVAVDLTYGGESLTTNMLFGVKNHTCWVEALPDNLAYIAKHLNHDYVQGNTSSRRHASKQDDREDASKQDDREDASVDGEACEDADA